VALASALFFGGLPMPLPELCIRVLRWVKSYCGKNLNEYTSKLKIILSKCVFMGKED